MLRLFLAVPWICAISSGVQASVQTAEAVDDGYVRGSEFYRNTVRAGGISGQLWIKNQPGLDVYYRKAYIKFDLSGMNADPQAQAVFTFRDADPVNSGTLRVWGLDAGFSPGVGKLGTDWSETLLTWSNAPANVAGGGFLDSTYATLIDTIGTSYNDPPGTAHLVTIGRLGDYLQADNTVTIGVTALTEYGAVFRMASSENTSFNGPELTFSVIPEPSTLVIWSFLITIGLAVPVLRRNRTK